MIAGARKYKICRAGCLETQAGYLSGSIENSFSWKPQSFFSKPSNDSIKPIHIMEGILLYSKSTDLNINHITIYLCSNI